MNPFSPHPSARVIPFECEAQVNPSIFVAVAVGSRDSSEFTGVKHAGEKVFFAKNGKNVVIKKLQRVLEV